MSRRPRAPATAAPPPATGRGLPSAPIRLPYPLLSFPFESLPTPAAPAKDNDPICFSSSVNAGLEWRPKERLRRADGRACQTALVGAVVHRHLGGERMDGID